MLASFLCGEFLLHILCWPLVLLFYFLSREFLLHIPWWLYFYLGSFTYTSRAGLIFYTSHVDFIFMWGVSLTHPVVASFFLFLFIRGVSLTHTMLSLFLPGEFLLHIPCWLHFCLGSFSYTCLLYTSPSPRDWLESRMPSSA